MIAPSSVGALRLLLQFVRAQEAEDPYAFRFAPQEYILPTADGGSPTARFDWSPELLADLQALRQPGCDPALVQRVGERLRRFVLGAGWLEHEAAITRALAEGRPVVLTLRSSAAELYALPWELLTLENGQRLGELHGLLLRFEWPESHTASQPPRGEGGRILYAWSAAGGAVPAAEHEQAIRKACAAGFQAFDPARDVLASASLARLTQRLSEAAASGEPIAVLHLLCHGGAVGSTYGLLLDGDFSAVAVDSAMLRQQLAPFAGMVRLVVLSACDSANLGSVGNHLGSLAQALHRAGFASVVASRFPLSVAGSVALTETLYGQLLGGPESLESAFLAARKRLLDQATGQAAGERSLDWASLQLYARHTDGDDSRPLLFRPYRGLLAFEPEHHRFYYGRTTEVAELVAKLKALSDRREPRLLIVAGASGSGKSSLVLAGALPRLLREEPALRWRHLRPGSHPEQALEQALDGLAVEGSERGGAGALLIIDQLEELFTHTDQAAVRSAFAERLWKLASQPAPSLQILVTLRVDFLGRCSELRLDRADGGGGLHLERVAYDEAHRVFVSQLGSSALRDCIVEPARKVGLELEPGLAGRMLTEVGFEPGTLPLLEDALDVLWQRRQGRVLTQKSYDEMGGVFGALQRRADAQLEVLADKELAMARRLFTSLVAVSDDTAQDTRRRVPLSELVPSCAGDDRPAFERLLATLVAARLLVQGGDGSGAQVEVAHETLIRKWPRLRAWLDEDRVGLALHRRIKDAVRQWESQQRDEGLLFRGGALAQAVDFRKTWEPRLAAAERRFLDESQALRERLANEEAARRQKEQQRARQARIAAAGLAFLLVIAIAASLRAYRESAKARNGLLVSVALALKDDPTNAALVLREAAQRDSTLWRQVAVNTLQAGLARDAWAAPAECKLLYAVSADGSRLVCSGPSGTLLLRSDGTAASMLLGGERSAIRAAAFSPDGHSVITGSADGLIQRVPFDGSPALRLLPENRSSVTQLAISPDGKKLAAAVYGDNNLVLVGSTDGSGGQIVLRGHESGILDLAFSPDGQRLAVAYGFPGLTASVFRSDGSGTPLVLSGHDAHVVAVAFDPTGNRLLTGSADRTARLHKLDAGGTAVPLTGHADEVVAVAFSHDGTRVVTASRDETLRIIEASSQAVLRTFQGQRNLAKVAFSTDDKSVVSTASDGAVRRWSLDEIAAPRLLRNGGQLTCMALAVVEGGRQLWCGASEDHSIRRFDLESLAEQAPLPLTSRSFLATAISPDGKHAATGSADGVVRLHDLSATTSPIEIQGPPQPIQLLSMSSDAKKLLVAIEEPVARLYDPAAPGQPLVLGGHEGKVTALTLSPDGRLAATGSQNGTLRIFPTDRAGPPRLLTGHAGPITALAFDGKGRTLVSAGEDRTVRRWKADGAGESELLLARAGRVTALAFSRDGQRLAMGSTDDRSGTQIAIGGNFSTALVMDLSGASEPLRLTGNVDEILAIAFSPDGERLITSTIDSQVRVYLIGSELLHRALWRETSACLPVARRRELLLESSGEAQSGWASCQREVAARR